MLSLTAVGSAGAQGTASTPDHPFDSTWLAAELARLGGEITAVVPPAGPHPEEPVLLNSALTNRGERTVGSTQPIAGGTIKITRRKRERADPAAQSFYYGQAGVYFHGTKRWMGYSFYATCGRLDAPPPALPCRAVLTLNMPTEPQAWVGVVFPRGDLAAMDATMRTAAELVVARTAEGRPLLLAPRPGAWDAAVPPPPLPPEPNGLRPGETPTLDDHPFDAAWLAAELARREAAVTAVVPSTDPHPPDFGRSLADLLRNQVAAFEVDAPDLAEPHASYYNGFIRLRRRGDPGAATYYSGRVSSGTRDPRRGDMVFTAFAVCGHEDTGSAHPPCRAAIRSETYGRPDTWIGVAFLQSRLAEINVVLHYAAELVAARDAEGSPLRLPPQPGAWDGLGRVPEAPPEAAGDPRPGEAAEERDHPFSSAWLKAELEKRETRVLKAVRAPGERVGPPEASVFGYVMAKAGGVSAELQDGMLHYQIGKFDPLGWYSSRAWTARGGAAVAYRFAAQCLTHPGGQLWTVCKADMYLEQPDMWLRVQFPSARRGEIGAIMHYAAEAAVAAEAEGRPMRGLLDTHP